jgi:glycosyltransferase involved in cell wall biosynthesis
MLAFQARLVFPTYLRGSHVLQMRKLDWNTILLARIARRMGIKTICVPQASGFRGDVATFPAGTVHELQPYDWVSALTPDIQREVIGWGYPASHIGLIPNGVDTDFFCPADTPAFPQSAVFVGQFRPEKRLDILLQAWKQIQTEYPQVKLTLIGGGSNVAEYQQMATGLGISPEFIPISNPKDVRNILQRNAVFVLPGTSEGMSNALLEGMAVGLAPVTSDVPGNRVLITPELNGLCYDSNMPEALAGQLRRLFSDPILQKRLGATAREMVTAQYSLSGVVDEYEALYRWLVQVS